MNNKKLIIKKDRDKRFINDWPFGIEKEGYFVKYSSPYIITFVLKKLKRIIYINQKSN